MNKRFVAIKDGEAELKAFAAYEDLLMHIYGSHSESLPVELVTRIGNTLAENRPIKKIMRRRIANA